MLALTGAAGFIGSNFMAAWEAHEDRPIAAFDTIDSPEKQFNVDKRRNVTWVGPADILTFLQANAELIEVVVHLGAETNTTASDRSAVFTVNVDLSTALWTWCAENSIPFIYASSASVYGDGTQGFNDDLSLGALNALNPLNLYGQSKLAFDTFVSQAVFDGSPAPPQWAGLRFFNVYGPNEIHKGTQASVVSQMHPIAAKGDAYALFRSHREGIGNGEQKRDFVFVDDCTAVIRWLLKTPTVTGLFNVGTGKARTFLDLARAVYTAADQPFTITWRDTPAHLQTHYQYFTEANMSRLEAVGYPDAFTSLEDGVTITIRDYLSNPNPYR